MARQELPRETNLPQRAHERLARAEHPNLPQHYRQPARWRPHLRQPRRVEPRGGAWSVCMRRNIAALMDCGNVATLPGWEQSKGARLEILIAEHLGMTVVNAHDFVTSAPE